MKTNLNIILIADDDVEEQELMNIAFTMYPEKYHLIFTNNGIELLDKLGELQNNGTIPSLVVMDVNMPILDGLSTLKELRHHAEYNGLPVVMYSNSTAPKLIDQCIAAGCTMYIPKPFTFNGILDSITRMIPYCINKGQS